jgi:hypothetical protein
MRPDKTEADFLERMNSRRPLAAARQLLYPNGYVLHILRDQRFANLRPGRLRAPGKTNSRSKPITEMANA